LFSSASTVNSLPHPAPRSLGESATSSTPQRSSSLPGIVPPIRKRRRVWYAWNSQVSEASLRSRCRRAKQIASSLCHLRCHVKNCLGVSASEEHSFATFSAMQLRPTILPHTFQARPRNNMTRVDSMLVAQCDGGPSIPNIQRKCVIQAMMALIRGS